MIENFRDFMEADDKHIYKPLNKKTSSANINKSQKNQEKLKMVYRSIIDTFKSIFESD